MEQHLEAWRATAARLGIYDVENECIVPGMEGRVIWLDEMPQFLS